MNNNCTNGLAGHLVILFALFGIMLFVPSPLLAAPSGHGNDKQHKETGKNKQGHRDKETSVRLKPESLKAQGIVVKVLRSKPVREALRTTAEIRYNERRRVALTARASGWAEEVAVFANQRVKKGTLLAKIYSAEFLSAQHEYLLILDRARRAGASDADAQSLLSDARQRLTILGLSSKELDALATSRTPFKYQHVHSPISGIVVQHKLATGGTVTPGQLLYVVASLRTVWAEIALTETQLGKVRPRQKVSLTVKAYPGRRFRGKVLSIGSEVDEVTRTIKARALIQNSRSLLKPGMFADADVTVGRGRPVLSLPANAVLRSPDGDWMVFVEEKPGQFKPVEIKVVRSVGRQTIIKGIKPGTRIVTRGAFFVQSELAKSGFDIHNH